MKDVILLCSISSIKRRVEEEINMEITLNFWIRAHSYAKDQKQNHKISNSARKNPKFLPTKISDNIRATMAFREIGKGHEDMKTFYAMMNGYNFLQWNEHNIVRFLWKCV